MAVRSMATRDREGTVLEAKKAKVKTPPMFKVLLLNDDYTPMDFVVLVLQKFFLLTPTASRLMPFLYCVLSFSLTPVPCLLFISLNDKLFDCVLICFLPIAYRLSPIA